MPVKEQLSGMNEPHAAGKLSMDLLAHYYIEDLHVNGTENLHEAARLRNEGHPLIYMANHLSNSDGKLLQDAVASHDQEMADDMVFLFGEKLARFRVTDFLKGAHNTITVWSPLLEPTSPEEEKLKKQMNMQALRTSRAAISQGYDLVVFPEGGRSKETLALKEAVPEVGYYALLDEDMIIVTAGIEGSENLLPPGKIIPQKASVTVTFGKPIPASQLVDRYSHAPKRDRYGYIIKDVMMAIRDCLSPKYHGIYGEIYEATY